MLGILGITALLPGFVTGSAPGIVISSLGVTVLICSALAVILGSASIGHADKRGERGGTMATAGASLGWIGVWFPVVLFTFLAIFGPRHRLGVPAFVFLGIAAALTYYTRRNFRR